MDNLNLADWVELLQSRWKCIWQIFLLFARQNLHNVLVRLNSKRKIYFDCNFPSSYFDVPKKWNFTSDGVQTHETKNRRLGMIVTSLQDLKFHWEQISSTFSYFLTNNAVLYHFLANLLAHNNEMTEKSVFRKLKVLKWRHNRSHSPVFWSRGFVPQRKWNFTFLVLQNTGKEKCFRICFCYTYQYIVEILSSKKKKNFYIHFNDNPLLKVNRTLNFFFYKNVFPCLSLV